MNSDRVSPHKQYAVTIFYSVVTIVQLAIFMAVLNAHAWLVFYLVHWSLLKVGSLSLLKVGNLAC